jgi:hypothetical protein
MFVLLRVCRGLIPRQRYPTKHLKDPYLENLILKMKRRENLIYKVQEEEI